MPDLWSFALRLYACPGVEDDCLQLQQSGSDVCLLLTAAWLEQRHSLYSDARRDELKALAGPWQQQVIGPLRKIRCAWREQAGNDAGLAELRKQVKELELQAEHLLLQRLQALCADWPCGNAGQPWLEQLAQGDGSALQRLRDAAHRL
ncbi:TIGR02444 family protein [Pseudomonas sp. NCCP-436]|uniref:TIGR02444 family protein n=1 Tax=Pseudomonas sp. NCCP-436 TaxID=2842481 RepID=UPI001C7EFBD6|nr:TIGR02444 family protein [Pseudomonas sp. NCCP-436]GIZ10874.1 hypothetical protein NCCP436_02900 [Pseudomonas sp. NCCP-436]